ncbi:tRNA:m(4)X modification enzyme TRM13 homolog [Episyrphus balteatus]|uniref:tRNA:m(4)X modification enzyme TRM13 homolog n=1 Tax=Episyrphus balteatus TaxID=286459 RepID=UPI002485315D|nr:tRNA:m(4)X modification enzyme TRM13 homolog [Episyrphus balteatus]
MEPEIKKPKTSNDEAIPPPPSFTEPTCKHFVKRKKRFCKMTVAKGKEYCGEHEPQLDEATVDGNEEVSNSARIPCPLDNKHSVYKKNLRKHLKICNARPMENFPPYIVHGVNCGDDPESELLSEECPKLSDVPPKELKAIIDKVKELYTKFVDGQIVQMDHKHEVLKEELANEEYGFETRKHLIQASALLGCLNECGLFKNSTSFIEFGAGKGHLSFWLAQALSGNESSKVILIDRMSHRHKKDNKIEDRNIVHRIRADIADFKMSGLDLIQDSKSIVAVSKHLCGAATDLTIRCILQDDTEKTDAILIALCCHHRCEWKPFVGKEFFLENGLTRKEFALITKMASWAICGTGFSREKRKQIDEESVNEDVSLNDVAVKEREEIGLQCKRVLDYSRVEYLRKNGYTTSLRSYVDKDVTLENICILALRSKMQ